MCSTADLTISMEWLSQPTNKDFQKVSAGVNWLKAHNRSDMEAQYAALDVQVYN